MLPKEIATKLTFVSYSVCTLFIFLCILDKMANPRSLFIQTTFYTRTNLLMVLYCACSTRWTEIEVVKKKSSKIARRKVCLDCKLLRIISHLQGARIVREVRKVSCSIHLQVYLSQGDTSFTVKTANVFLNNTIVLIEHYHIFNLK